MKQKTIFFCTECGTESPKWMGKCPGCGAWNTMSEEIVQETPKGVNKSTTIASSSKPKLLKDISTSEDERISTGFGELDRVLGGGIVNVFVGAPETEGVVFKIRLTVLGSCERQHTARIRAVLLEHMLFDMLGDVDDVFHDMIRFTENIGVDFLEDILYHLAIVFL